MAAVAMSAAVLAPAFPAADAEVTPTRDLAYAGAGGPRLDVHLPPGAADAPRPAVVLVHGGAWTRGSRAKMAGIADRLAGAGFVTFNVGYTLAAPGRPGHPTQLRELRAAVRWIRMRAARFGVDPGGSARSGARRAGISSACWRRPGGVRSAPALASVPPSPGRRRSTCRGSRVTPCAGRSARSSAAAAERAGSAPPRSPTRAPTTRRCCS